MIAGVGSLIVLTGLIAGVAQLVSGQLGEALPFVSIPLVLVAAFVGLNVAGLRSLEREIPKLVHDLNRILDSAHDGATS